MVFGHIFSLWHCGPTLRAHAWAFSYGSSGRRLQPAQVPLRLENRRKSPHRAVRLPEDALRSFAIRLRLRTIARLERVPVRPPVKFPKWLSANNILVGAPCPSALPRVFCNALSTSFPARSTRGEQAWGAGRAGNPP